MYPFKKQDLHIPNIDEVAKGKYYVKSRAADLYLGQKKLVVLLWFKLLKNKSRPILEKASFCYYFFFFINCENANSIKLIYQ